MFLPGCDAILDSSIWGHASELKYNWNDNSSKNRYDWLKPNWRFARPTRVVLLAEVEANFESMAWRG